MIDVKAATLSLLDTLRTASEPACRAWGEKAIKEKAYTKSDKPVFARFNQGSMALEFGEGSFDEEFSTNGKPWVNNYVQGLGAYRA